MDKKDFMGIPDGKISIDFFKNIEIRKIMHKDEWWYSVIDVAGAITQSKDAGAYWSILKGRINKDGGQLETNCFQLKLPSKDGKERLTDCANIEGLFRIIQSIPSPNAEPFKKWLARTGYERVLESQNPSIAIKRAIADYKIKGRDDKWIKERLQTVITRNELTTEWQNRNVKEGKEYAILTDTISKGTFGVKTTEHKKIKSLNKNHSLRDNMSQLELILTMLGEETTRQIAISMDADGFKENYKAAEAGGEIAGTTRVQIEEKTKNKVITSENFLPKK